MFCGKIPVAVAILSSSSFDETTPIKAPCASMTGPPLLPGWIGAESWNSPRSPSGPLRPLTTPVVIFSPEPTRSPRG